jgi:IS1 family transposase/transposase-like protein
MVDDLLFHELLLLALLWLCVIQYWMGRWRQAMADQAHGHPAKRATRRSQAPKPFPDLTTKPRCDACERAAQIDVAQASPGPPLLVASTRGRPRTVATHHQFCPEPTCRYYGWIGRGNIRANGHPGGGPWRQLSCVACGGYFLETHGTPLHGKRVPTELIVRVVASLAEGLGIRAAARVFEVGPNTVLVWLIEAADHLEAFSQALLHDVQVQEVQLDELYAVLSAVKAGQMTEAGAIERLECSPHWVWVAIDPVSKLLLAIDVGERTLAMAQRVVHQVAQVLAPGCVPLFLTDGFKEYTMVLLTHYGQWVQPPRRQANGPAPKARWMPLSQLLYAQVVKHYRRRHLVGVRHRVVFGTLAGVKHVLASRGWQINTAFIERVNLTIRQHVAAVGRRVMTLCKGEAGLRQQLALYHVYYNFCLPHVSLRHPLPLPEPTHGTGSVKTWRSCTPAMAAGLTDRVWTLREVLLFRLPPWPQPQKL